MKKARTTKTALLLSLIAMLACFSMLLGTTFAWFTDSETSGMNNIITGNLDVAMNYWDAEAEKYLDATNVSLFDEEALWEPGYTSVAYLEIENRGNLSFNFLFAVYPKEEVPGYLSSGEQFYLSDYLVYAIVDYDVEEQGEITSRESAMALVSQTQMGLTQTNFQYGTMHPESDSRRLALIVYMPTYVTSEEANYDPSQGYPAPRVKLAVDVYATQNTHEFDSFDNLYDSGITPVWEKPLWRYAPDGYTVDEENKRITVNTAEALKYLGTLYDDMISHPRYEPSEWEIVLGADIDFNGETLTEPLRAGGFKSLNGNNKTITNVILNYIYVDEALESVGLFDALPSAKDITLQNVTVKSTGTAAGVLAGSLTGTEYSNIVIKDSSASGVGYIGGMFGYCNFLHPIDFSGIQIFRTDLSLFGDGTGSVGGIGGYIGGDGEVTVTGSTVGELVVDAPTGSYVGGMFGEINSGMTASTSTITEITIYRDVYIGAVTGKIYSTRDVKLVSNSVSVVVSENGTKSIIPLSASGAITDTDTEIDWKEVEKISGVKLQTTYNGHFYEVFKTTASITWTDAKADCESKNGHLATITDAGENSAVATIVANHGDSAWLGAYRPVCYGAYEGPHTFVWVTGEPWEYSSWSSGEPNDAHPHEGDCENCLHMYASGEWNDYQYNHSKMFGYVCEWDTLQAYLNYLTALQTP